MKLYEISVLAKDEAGFKKIGQEIAKITKPVKEQILGLKKLAYPIKKQTEGFLGGLWIKADEEIMKKLRQTLQYQENLLRSLILCKQPWEAEEPTLAEKLKARVRVPKAEKPQGSPKIPAKKTTEKHQPAQSAKIKKVKPEDEQTRLKTLDKKLEEILKE